MDKKKIWNLAKFIFKLCFTATLIYLVFQKINYTQVKTIALQSNPFYIVISLALLFLSQVVSSWRLLGFLISIGIPVSFKSNLRLYFLGLFYNNFLPGGIGGDGYKIYLLNRKYKAPVKNIFLSLLFDRLSGLWAICAIGCLFAFLLPAIFISHAALFFIFLCSTVIYYLVVNYFFKEYSSYFLPAHFKALTTQMLQVFSVIMILLSQHDLINYIPYLFSFLVSSVATAVPISFGGVGIREYVMMNMAGPLHINAAIAIFTTLSFYILSLVVAIPGLLLLLGKNEWSSGSREN